MLIKLKFFRFEIVVFVLSIATRLLYFALLKQDPVLLTIEGLDSAVYLKRAAEIMAGDWLGKEPLFHSGYLYPYMLSLLGCNRELLIAVQMVLDSLSTVILYRLGRDMAGPPMGLIAAVLYVFCAVVIFSTGTLLFDPWVTFFVLLGVHFLHKGASRQRLIYWFVAGLALALAGTAKPFVLLLLPVALFGWVLPCYAPSKARMICALLSCLVGPGLIFGAVGLRNRVVTGEYLFAPAGGGFAFYLGNNPLADGTLVIPKHLGIKNLEGTYSASTLDYPARKLGRSVSPSEGSHFWFREGLAFWRDSPGRALRLTGRKLAMLFNATEVSDNYIFDLYRSRVFLLRWLPDTRLIMALGLVGVLIGFLRWRQTGLLVLAVGLYVICLPLFWMSARFRYPMVALLTLLAAVSVLQFWDAVRHRHWGRLTGGLALLAAAFAVTWYPLTNLSGLKEQSAKQLANAYIRQGKNLKALQAIEEVSHETSDARLLLMWAQILARQGERPGAIEILKKVVSLDPSLDEAHSLIEQLASEQRSTEETALNDRAKQSPSSWSPQAELARYYIDHRRYNEALRTVREAITCVPENEECRFLLAVIYSLRGKPEESILLYQKLLVGKPDSVTVLANLGFAYLDTGRFQEAEKSFRKAVSLNPRFALAYFGLGLVYKFFGRYEQARANYERFLELEPPRTHWSRRARNHLEEIAGY